MTEQNVERVKLPGRREQILVTVTHLHVHGHRSYSIGFGITADGTVKEIFCVTEKTGAELDALISDACIVASHLLQRGATISEIAGIAGQLRPEGASDGDYPPASPFGSIARAGIIVEKTEQKRRGGNVIPLGHT